MFIMAAKTVSLSDLIESHRPKHFNHVYILTEENYKKLKEEGYDMSKLDTLHRPDLVSHISSIKFEEHGREIIGKAKEPTILGDGLIVSKMMVTKSDKKLLSFDIGEFMHEDHKYLVIRLRYEYFDILEFFIKVE
jgi:hypothetical protein